MRNRRGWEGADVAADVVDVAGEEDEDTDADGEEACAEPSRLRYL
jgi:hypothetical protein